jgi:pyruvate dehydrogenase E1 component alpha subunit
LKRSSAFKTCLAERAEGFAMAWGKCDGTDIYEVRANVQTAMERAHKESKPTLLEITTYRYYGHSVADSKHQTGYRQKDEIERYKQNHDPITAFKRRLIEERVLTEEHFEQIEDAAKAEAEASAEFADQSPIPNEASITEDVYFEVDRQTEAGRTGKHFFND